VTPARRRYLLLELAQRHIAIARRGGAQAIAALRDAAICALLATRATDDVSLPGEPPIEDSEPASVDPRTNARGGSA
jgi:hypothetical protein